MYIPKINKQEDRDSIAEFVQQNNFGIVINTSKGVPIATHIPLELFVENGKWTIKGHIAKANQQWQYFEETKSTLVIFSDAHTYISSSWYQHLNVPTWNYIAVHLYGNIRMMYETELQDFIAYQLKKYEANSEKPVKIESFGKDDLRRQLKGIIGFEIKIQDIQARYKLSQNRNEEDFKNVILELQKRKDAHSHEIAKQMKKIRKL